MGRIKTCCLTIRRYPITIHWYQRTDSNRHCSEPKSDASYQLGYVGIVAVNRVELFWPSL